MLRNTTRTDQPSTELTMTHALLLVLVVGLPKGESPTDQLVAGFIREDLLQLGAPGRLLMAGELDAVLPADDAKLLDAADPVNDGKIEFNSEAGRAREEGMVRLLLKQKEAVVVMGGAHDLANNLPAAVEYVRAKTRGYKLAAE